MKAGAQVGSTGAGAAEPSVPYTVIASDKLIVLARTLLRSPQDWNEVARFNGLRDPNRIGAGQTIRIPLRLLKPTATPARIVSAAGLVTVDGTPAPMGSAVSEGAKVETGADSSAVIELGDGSRIKLLPSTLTEVAVNRHYVLRDQALRWFSNTMRLTRGGLEAVVAKVTGRATPLQIITPTSTVGARGTEFRVAFDDPAAPNSRAEVTEGTVRADNTQQGTGAALPPGTGAVVRPAERVVNVVPLLPAPDLAALPADARLPASRWPLPQIPGAVGYRVQLAQDAAFDRIVRDLKVPAQQPAVELGALPPGPFFVRVRGIDPQGIEGFDAARALALVLARLRVTDSWLRVVDGRTRLEFTLDPTARGPYEVTLSADAASTTGSTRTTIAGTVLDLGTPTQGRYVARIRAADGSETEALAFEITPSWGRTVFDSFNPLQPLAPSAR